MAPKNHPRKKACFGELSEIAKKNGIKPTQARGQKPGSGKITTQRLADRRVSKIFLIADSPLYDSANNKDDLLKSQKSLPARLFLFYNN